MKNIYLSELAAEPLTEYLKDHGFNIVTVDEGAYSPVYDAISTHADIHMCQLGLWENSRIFPGKRDKLAQNYPGNIIYNAVCTGKYFIHNLKYTDRDLLESAKERGDLKFVNVRQGYSRCSCLPVDDSSFITSDMGMMLSLESAGADVLLIQTGYITLPGFDYGFIGGCAGNIVVNGRRTIVFNGDLTSHPDCKKIAAFIEGRDMNIVYFPGHPLEDIGSILTGDIVD